jgi:Family of unknown function (DUF5999)
MCQHQPQCPDALAPDRMAAHVAVSHPEQGWSLLCNGIVLFDDSGALLPGGQAVVAPAAGGGLATVVSLPAAPGGPAAEVGGARLIRAA